MALLEMRGISKRFGGAVALAGVDFALRAGEVHGLVGENGAGKSTMMKIIAGVHTDYDGEMVLDGEVVRFRSARDARDRGIGMVHQELSIVPELSVAENVLLGMQPTNRAGVVAWRRMAQMARGALADIGLDLDVSQPVGALPLGVQQMVELARVLHSGARIIILDEPTSALSPPEVARLFDLLGRLRGGGRAFVFISHFLDDILQVSDVVSVFRNGRRVGSAPVAGIDKAWLIERMIGAGHAELEESYTAARALPGRAGTAAVLEAEGLTVAGLFEDVSLEVRAGEVLGIYGFMGSGQLELARALSGKLRLERGVVRVDGRAARLSGGTPAAKRAGLAFVPESRRAMLFGAEPIYKNISISFLERISRLWVRPEAERRIAWEQVRRLGVRPSGVEMAVGSLSGGNQQKVALGRWLVHLPRVLLLSEPTRGMDVGAKEEVAQIVRSLREEKMGVVVVSSEPETVLSLADRILVMKRGVVAREFVGEDVSKDILLAAA